jgi:hypothetical protein
MSNLGVPDTPVLAQYAIHRLFHNSEPESLSTDAQKELARITAKSSPIWGVFTTIHRSPEQSLPNWPEDIHGCLGYYQINPINAMSARETLSQIAGLVVRTNTSDDRNKFFPRPVEQDSGASIEVSIMHGKLMPISPSSGQITSLRTGFNNQKFGLVVIDPESGYTATYLPGVFPSTTTWPELTKSLLSKAGIQQGGETSQIGVLGQKTQKKKRLVSGTQKSMMVRNSSIKWFAYRTTTSTCRLVDYLLAPWHALMRLAKLNSGLADLIISMAKQNPHREIPYEVQLGPDGAKKVLFDNKQYVRNISMYLDMQSVAEVLVEKSRKNKELLLGHKLVDKPLDWISGRQYLKPFETDNILNFDDSPELAQAAAHALGLSKLVGDKHLMNIIYDFLHARVDAHKLEPSFEWGQVLIALIKFNPGDARLVDLLIGELSRIPELGADDIFGVNWHIQILVAVCRAGLNKKSAELGNQVSNIGRTLAAKFINLAHRILVDSAETNYWAVGFEAATGLEYLVRSGGVMLGPKDRIELQNQCVSAVYNLERRYDYKIGAYKFKDGTARLDITGHVLIGWLNLIFNFYVY